ncbi:hypothetical protein G7Z17_g3427 [Cylindrodendrum hubeiense]|uniref:Uncharacterized protein n=1 Tax=Cylindrodendrum hubeiense TaxID=595255 RepID=A0A9P5HAT6_9HYPO|nr:hypothetical protein G7Z17_g3427 [Cylindrodendrum hubeiense]
MAFTDFIHAAVSKSLQFSGAAADKLLKDASHQSWLRAGLCLSGAFMAYSVNQTLNKNALNHGEKAVFDWSKEVVLVTGGSGGIGGETVQRLAAGGTTVVVLDLIPLTYPEAENIHYYQCNLTDYEQLHAVAAKIRQ